MKGGQAALEVGFFSAAVAIIIGALYGAISGLGGGFLDAVLMRIVDVFLSIPFLFIVLIVAVRYGASVLSLSLLIGGFSWLVPARLVRGEVLALRVRDFMSAARVAGAGRARLIGRRLLPNALGVVIVNVTFQVADAILAIAALGFLSACNGRIRTGATCCRTASPTSKTVTGGRSTRSAPASSSS